MTHPSREQLALFVGRDLGWWGNRTVGRHVAACKDCGPEVRALERARAAARVEAGGIPSEVNWDRLAAEMKANIRLGVAAGECVSLPQVNPLAHSWRATVALATVVLVVVGGWWWRGPGESQRAAAPRVSHDQEAVRQEVILKATLGGIGVERGGLALAIAPEKGQERIATASTLGSLRARYLDENTGQVTIHHVYVE